MEEQSAVSEIDNQQRSTLITETNEVPERNGTIYLLTFPNGKKYVGQTIQKFEQRLSIHKWCSKNGGGCKALSAAIKTYGWDNVNKEVIWTGPASKLNEKEIELIAEHNAMAPNGYNLQTGGQSIISAEAFARMREAGRNRDYTNYRRSEEAKSLPKYVSKIPGGYIIHRHPRCPTKSFRSTTDDEFNRMDAISFLRMLDEDPTIVVTPKNRTFTGSVRSIGPIYSWRDGYRVAFRDSDGRNRMIESSSKKYTKEEHYARISARLAELKTQLIT